jgi:hypothetical protein
MKKFKQLSEQHREKGRFHPVKPHNVSNLATVSPRPSSDSASAKLKEEKKDKYDEGEYDQEGDMAKSDLRSIMANSKKLHDMIEDADNLPEWCQNKITLAEDYISTVANYMTAEMNEEVKTVTVKHKTSGKELVVSPEKAKQLKPQGYHPVKEEVEQIEEGIEVKKEHNDKTEAEHGVYHNGKKIGYVVHHKPSGTHTAYHSPQDDDDYGQIDDFRSHHDAVSQIRHSAGVGVHEEVEQIDELSNTTLKSYMKNKKEVEGSGGGRLGSGYSDEKSEEGTRSAIRRLQARKNQIGKYGEVPKVPGYNKEEVEQIDEKNVPTSPEKWAQAKSQAKAKFDVYPSAYANGWAAKKYKAMGGGWKSVSEAKEEPPFDKPYTTVKKVVTDKSGAKHSPMSRARDIARAAMKKQMEKMKPVKESLEESRKAEIVKEIMKKKKDKSEDAFQKDPELTTTLTKVI